MRILQKILAFAIQAVLLFCYLQHASFAQQNLYSGDISFEGPILKESQAFDANSLHIGQLYASGTISRHDGEGIMVQISGDDTALKTVKISLKNHALKIHKPSNAGKSVFLRIRIPENTPISLDTIGAGEWNFDKIDSKLSIISNGQSAFNVGSLDAPSVDIVSRGDISFSSGGGEIKSLHIRSIGNSAFSLDGKVHNLNSVIVGRGSIAISKPVGKITQGKIIGEIKQRYQLQK